MSKPCQARGEEHKHAVRDIEMLREIQPIRPFTLHNISGCHAYVKFGRCLWDLALPPVQTSGTPL